MPLFWLGTPDRVVFRPGIGRLKLQWHATAWRKFASKARIEQSDDRGMCLITRPLAVRETIFQFAYCKVLLQHCTYKYMCVQSPPRVRSAECKSQREEGVGEGEGKQRRWRPRHNAAAGVDAGPAGGTGDGVSTGVLIVLRRLRASL